ncbi:MAG: hypothetical protein JW861_08950 [Bacteroidales bacterium]|nr:hypothetical protein [Bacteroidales bacterium]
MPFTKQCRFFCEQGALLKWLFPVLFASLAVLSIHSQESSGSFPDADRETYRLYQEEKWDSLVIVASSALGEGLDWFYLRMRLAFARYYLGQYRQAAYQFRKALEFNASDPAALEHLYYSCLYTNCLSEAQEILFRMPPSLRDKAGVTSVALKPMLLISSVYGFSNNLKNNSGKRLLDHNSFFGERDLNGDFSQSYALMVFPAGRRVRLTTGYNFLSLEKLRQIEYGEIYKSGYDTILDNGYFYVDTLYDTRYHQAEDRYFLNQHGLYASADIWAGRGWVITPALHFLHAGYSTLFSQYQTVEYFRQSYDTLPSFRPGYTLAEGKSNFDQWIVSAGIIRDYPLWQPGLRCAYSNLNGENQFLASPSLSWFPRGNQELYTSARMELLFGEGEAQSLFHLKAGGKILPQVWSEISAGIGKMRNYNELNGLAVFNSGDDIRFRIGMDIVSILSRNLEVTLRYTFYGNSLEYEKYSESGKSVTHQINYRNHHILGGIKWNM